MSHGRVVVGVDGTSAADAALDRAVAEARRARWPLEVVCAWNYPAARGGYPVFSSWFPEADAQEAMHATLERRFPDGVPSWVHPRVIGGRPATVLVEVSHGASLLVVGSRGRAGIVRLVFGSVSADCAEHASCPVLVVRVDPGTPGHDVPASVPAR